MNLSELFAGPTELGRCLGPSQNFLGLSAEQADLDRARAVIVPAPYDATTTFRSGTRDGPRAILQASRELETYDEETRTEIYRRGIATLEELAVTVASPRLMVERVRTVAAALFNAGKLPVLLGGEHLLSLGMIEAARAQFPDLTILQLDAHADLRPSYQESSYSNACVMRLAQERTPLVQVGIRALTREEDQYIVEQGIPCYQAHQLHREPRLWRGIPGHLSPHVYITIDLDAFDPSIMPAVGTPEPGGLGWYDVLRLLREVAATTSVVGFDVMELLPLPHQAAPDLLAARLVYKLLAYILMDKP